MESTSDSQKIPTPPVPSPEPSTGTVKKPINPLLVLERMALVLQLQRRSRLASAEELPFIMVNETRQLLPYRQAVLYSLQRGGATLSAVSGLAVPDQSAPYAQWLSKFIKWRLDQPEAEKHQRLNLEKMTANAVKPPIWLPQWKEWLPPHALWAPLFDGTGRILGILALFREEPFPDQDSMLFSHLSEAYGQSYALASVGRRRRVGHSRFWLGIILLLAAIAAFFIPASQTVLAPAEVSARRPALVRAGLDGVISRFLVEPNQHVEKGDRLILLEDDQLRTRLAVARKAEEMAAAEYRQLLQSALSDAKTKQRLPLALGRMEQLAAETAYVESLMERVVINSPMRGVVLCDNPDEWLGRPVSLGQRIMLVADPEDLELEIRLPASEALRIEVGDKLLFYPNIAPISPMEAVVTFVGYRASEAAGLGIAFTLRADLAKGGKPLLGLRGMAKLYGKPQPLGLNLLRTPIQAVRQWLGI